MDRAPIIAFDFDGTLCEDNFPFIGQPNHWMIDTARELRSLGCKTILWTCRVGSLLDSAVEWCSEYNLSFDAVNDNVPDNIAQYGTNSRKVFADLYVDDKSCANWPLVVQKLKKLKEEMLNEYR